MRAAAGVRAGLVGAASGLRSQIGMAAVAVSGRAATAPPPLDLLSGRPAVLGTVTAAVGELIADKLPTTPCRLGAAGLTPRVLLGGLAAAVLAADVARTLAPPRGRPPRVDGGDGPPEEPAPPSAGPVLLACAGAVGGAAAVAAAFAGARWRYRWAQHGCADWPAAVLEDLVALALAEAACNLPGPPPRTGDAAW